MSSYSLETQLIAKITDIEQRYVATILWGETDVRQFAIKINGSLQSALLFQKVTI